MSFKEIVKCNKCDAHSDDCVYNKIFDGEAILTTCSETLTKLTNVLNGRNKSVKIYECNGGITIHPLDEGSRRISKAKMSVDIFMSG